MFGRRKREEQVAAAAVREDERRVLFAKLAERPENICPFLGLAGERAGYVDGVSDEHRCFAFGDPAPLSAEQQTRVCQERGYGNCPRYLRGVLVIPTEELESLRRSRTAPPAAPPPTPRADRTRDDGGRRRHAPIMILVGMLLLVVVGGAAAWMLINRDGGVAIDPSHTPSPTPEASAPASEAPSAPASAPPTPTAEPTPEAGDTFAFYEVSVGPDDFTLYDLNAAGDVVETRSGSFDNYSFAEAEPRLGTDGRVYWETSSGELSGLSYLWPDSGDFGIRAVFLSGDGERRSVYLDESDLSDFPEATPSP